MTKEITKAVILQEIQDKLKLREFAPQNFLFDETVVPVYNIEQHLLRRVATFESVSITATGLYYFFTVPQNERWEFHRYDVVFMGAGAYTVAGVLVKRKAYTDTVYLDLAAGQSASYHVALPVPEVLDPGDLIGINIDGYTSTLDLRLYIDFTRENIR